MRNGILSIARFVLPCAALLSSGCQSPWQSGAPAASGGGWFSWMSVSERSNDPLTRLSGGGAYGPGGAEADANAKGSRQQLYGARTSELDLSRKSAALPEGAVASQSPPTKTIDEALPATEDDAAARVARALQSRQTGAATPALATGPDPSEGYDAAIAPAGYQAPASTAEASVPSIGAAPRTYVGTAPPDSQSNPFYDPFGEGSRSDSAARSQPMGSISSAFAAPPASSNSGSPALRLLTTPQASTTPTAALTPTLTYPSGSTSAAPTGSLLRLLGDNPLRKDAPPPSGN